MTSELTILNAMADADFDRCLRVHKEWGLRWLDLRDSIYGRNIADLETSDAERARSAIDEEGGWRSIAYPVRSSSTTS